VGNYLMSILKYYNNYNPNVGEVTIWVTFNNMPASDGIPQVYETKKNHNIKIML
jgi:hypothetical protein